MNYYFIANPYARNGLGRNKLEQLRERLRRRGVRHELAFCATFDHARELSRKANLAGYDVIVAVGGDGTINRVLNGFFDGGGRRLSGARLGVVHIGASPDFCRSYGVPTAVGPAVEVLCSGRARAVSVGRVSYTTAQGEETGPASAVFGCCANIGLGAALARLANAGIRQFLGDFLGTFVSLLRVLARYRPQTLQIALDGHLRRWSGVYNIAVGKTACIASGIKVRHTLGAQDSRFYVLCVRNLAWNNFARVLRALYSGRPIVADSSLSLEYAGCVELAPVEGTTEVEFDGDPAGRCPCRIETAPDPVDLITSEDQ
jgi:diacylglycerol kinase family enzyme